MPQEKVSDFTSEIPQRAFINAQIIQKVISSSDFQQTIKEVADSYGLMDYNFLNPAYISSLLYCLLVVPREVFLVDNDSNLDQLLPAASVLVFFDIKHDTENVRGRSSQFIRRLRNSVAHARFTVDNEMNFTFTDKRNCSSVQDEFVVEASASSLMLFLSKIGAFLANLRTSPL